MPGIGHIADQAYTARPDHIVNGLLPIGVAHRVSKITLSTGNEMLRPENSGFDSKATPGFNKPEPAVPRAYPLWTGEAGDIG